MLSGTLVGLLLMEEHAIHHLRWWRRRFYLEPFRVFIFSRSIHGIDWSGSDLAEMIAMIKWGFFPRFICFCKVRMPRDNFFSSARCCIFLFIQSECQSFKWRKKVVKIVIAIDCQCVWAHQNRYSGETQCFAFLSSHLLSYTRRTLCWTSLCSLCSICTRFSFKCHSAYTVSFPGSHTFLLSLIFKWVLTLRAGHLHVIITNNEKTPTTDTDSRRLCSIMMIPLYSCITYLRNAYVSSNFGAPEAVGIRVRLRLI